MMCLVGAFLFNLKIHLLDVTSIQIFICFLTVESNRVFLWPTNCCIRFKLLCFHLWQGCGEMDSEADERIL